MKRLTALPVALAALSFILCSLVYVTGQQILRQGANDPQIQFAEDAANRLSKNEPVDVQAFGKVDIASSLAPFMLTYDNAGKLVSSSAVLHDKAPSIPAGVLTYAKDHHEDRLTWQPEDGVRIAAVAVSYDGGTVVVGRSLGEVEKRESQLLYFAAAAFLASLVLIGGYVALKQQA